MDDELNEAKEFDKSILEELNLEHVKYMKIIDCLNAFEKYINEEFCCPLSFDIRDKFVVFVLAKKKIEFIKENLLNPDSLESFALKVFELLFIGKSNFNYDQLDKKVNLFQIILKSLMEKPMKDKELIYIKEVIDKRPQWKRLIESLMKNFGFVAFILSVYIDFAKSTREIIEILLEFLRLMHNYGFEVKFDINNISDFNESYVAEDFLILFNDKTVFFYLDYEEGHIIKKFLEPGETIQTINELTDNGTVPQKKRKKKKNKNKNKKTEKINEEKTEDQKSDGEYDSISKIKNIDEEVELENEDKSEDNQCKTEVKKIKENKDNEIWIKLNEMEEKIKKLNSENEKLKKENLVSKLNAQKLKKEMEENSQKMKEMEANSQKMKEMEANSQKMEKEIVSITQKMQKQIDASNLNSLKTKKKLYEVEDQLERVKTDLNIIKSRGAIKIFIDYFYKGMEFKDKPTYQIKVKRLLAKLNNFYKKENEADIVTMVKILLKNAVIKLILGNIEAHSLDKDQPFFVQLFRIIDPDGDYAKVEKRLNYLKADHIIKRILEVREDYYFDKSEKEAKDKVLSSLITPKTIYSIFVK